jgi:hypothetical protein
MKKQKKAQDQTTDEVVHHLFGKRLVEHLKDCAHCAEERARQGKRSGGSSSRPKK